MMKTSNQKYEITDIAHEKYPFLHRIRALQDIGSEVRAGDWGGFVESENNLSFEAGDTAWIFDDAIAAGDALIDKGSCLRNHAVVCDSAYMYISHGSVLSDRARAEDCAYVRSSVLSGYARASGNSMILGLPDAHGSPTLSDDCAVYGKVSGDVQLKGKAVVFSGEAVCNDSVDTLVIDEHGRSIIRDPSRDKLLPSRPAERKKKPKEKGQSR